MHWWFTGNYPSTGTKEPDSAFSSDSGWPEAARDDCIELPSQNIGSGQVLGPAGDNVDLLGHPECSNGVFQEARSAPHGIHQGEPDRGVLACQDYPRHSTAAPQIKDPSGTSQESTEAGRVFHVEHHRTRAKESELPALLEHGEQVPIH